MVQSCVKDWYNEICSEVAFSLSLRAGASTGQKNETYSVGV